MKKKYINYYLLAGIIFLGLILRLVGLNRPFGLGYDEAITYSVAIKSFPLEIIDTLIKTDVHMPLYFLALNLWMKLFTNADIALRLLSVVSGILAIFLGYIAGKEIKNEKTGLITAILLAVNALAIHYSQEVRFYSFITLFSTLTLLFLIKTANNPNKNNIFCLIFSSMLLIYTNTISIIFVAIIFFGLALFLFFNHKYKFKLFVKSIIIGQLFLLPFYWMIYQISINHGKAFPDVLFFDNQVIFEIIQNWFSPVSVGLDNNVQNYLVLLFKNISIASIIFIFIPVIMSFVAIFKNNFKKPVNIIIFSTIIIFILIELIESYLHKFTILPRYTLFVLPFIIILIATGIDNFKNKKAANSLVVILILINLIYFITAQISAPKAVTGSGQRIPALVLKEYKINKNDIVIYPIRSNLSDKYYQNGFTQLKMLQIFADLYPKNNPNFDGHSYYKEILKNENSEIFQEYFDKEIYEKLSPHSRLVLVIQKDFMPYDLKTFSYILGNDTIYKHQPLLFMKLFRITTDFVLNSQKKLALKKVYNLGNWMIAVYEKKD